MAKGHKWDKLKSRFSPFVDQTFREQVDAQRTNFGRLSFAELKDEFAAKRLEKDGLDDQISGINIDLMAIGQLLVEHLDAMGLNSISTENGHRIGTTVEPQITVEDVDKFEEWVASDPQRDYLWTVNAMTRQSLVKEILDRGDDEQLPPGLKITHRTAIHFTKAA